MNNDTVVKVNHYIEVNKHQPLDLIVNSLESIGFKLTFKLTDNPKYVTIGTKKNFGFFHFRPAYLHDEITIVDLVAMVKSYNAIHGL